MFNRALPLFLLLAGCVRHNHPQPSPDLGSSGADLGVGDDMQADMQMDAPDMDAPDMASAIDMTLDPCMNSNYPTGWDSSCGASLHGDPTQVYHCYQRQTIWTDPCPAGCHAAPNGVPDYCESPAGPPPPTGNGGKGLWIWDMTTPNHANGHAPDPQTIATMASSLGVGFVLIKSGEDDAYWDWNFSAATIAPFLQAGIEVYAWPYVRPGNAHFNTTQSHISAALQAATIPGVKGIILDVEEEFKRTYTYPGDPAHDPRITYGADATALCKGIRAGLPPGVMLGYTTFGYVYYNTSFPYKEFDTDCGDAFLAQTYYIAWTAVTPQQAYNVGCGGAVGLGLHAPCWAAQDNCESTGQESTQNLIDFFNVAGPRASIWRLYSNTESAPCGGISGQALNTQFSAITNWKNN